MTGRGFLHHQPGSARTPADRPAGGCRARLARSTGTAGGTTLELLFAITVLLVGLLGYSRSLVQSVELGQVNRDTAIATEAVRQKLEELYGTPFAEVFATYNQDPGDDPGGAGTAPGNLFPVAGLDLRQGDADGMHGEVVLPSAGPVLNENVADAALGMPRDLDLDGVVTGNDHAGDYRLLPVLVRVEWRSGQQPREFEVQTIMAAR